MRTKTSEAPVVYEQHHEQHYEEPVHEPVHHHEETIEVSQKSVSELLSRYGGGIRHKPVHTRAAAHEHQVDPHELYRTKTHVRSQSVHSIQDLIQQEEAHVVSSLVPKILLRKWSSR